jgi:integrase
MIIAKEVESREIVVNDYCYLREVGQQQSRQERYYITLKKCLLKAEIKNVKGRNIVPYSFRHTFITKRVNSGLPIASVAEMCGTSITQIEKTYYHTTEAKMISNALADYEYKEGLLVPIVTD